MKTIVLFVISVLVGTMIGQLLIKRAYYQGQQDKICACELKDICTKYNIVPLIPKQEGVTIYECRIETK